MIFSYYFVKLSENIWFSLVVSYELEKIVHDRNDYQIMKEARKHLNKKIEKQNKTTRIKGQALNVLTTRIRAKP